MSLPIYKDDNKNLMLLQNAWSSTLDPVINRVTNQANILKNISLVSGTNTINHLLGRKLQGWSIVRQRSAASIYDNQDANQMPALTLVLVSSANVVVDLEVF